MPSIFRIKRRRPPIYYIYYYYVADKKGVSLPRAHIAHLYRDNFEEREEEKCCYDARSRTIHNKCK